MTVEHPHLQATAYSGGIPDFVSVPDHHEAAILQMFESRRVAAGEVLLSYRQRPEQMVLILDGLASIRRGRAGRSWRVGQGTLAGTQIVRNDPKPMAFELRMHTEGVVSVLPAARKPELIRNLGVTAGQLEDWFESANTIEDSVLDWSETLATTTAFRELDLANRSELLELFEGALVEVINTDRLVGRPVIHMVIEGQITATAGGRTRVLEKGDFIGANEVLAGKDTWTDTFLVAEPGRWLRIPHRRVEEWASRPRRRRALRTLRTQLRQDAVSVGHSPTPRAVVLASAESLRVPDGLVDRLAESLQAQFPQDAVVTAKPSADLLALAGKGLILVDATGEPPDRVTDLLANAERVVELLSSPDSPRLPNPPSRVTRTPVGWLRERRGSWPSNPWPIGTVRVQLGASGHDFGRPYSQQPPSVRRDLDALGRAITERRVALALGGGGAWGFAHVALIRALSERGVPIDVLSGSSFGTVVAAYYGACGLDGLERLLDPKVGRAYQCAIAQSLVCEDPIARQAERDFATLGHPEIDLRELRTVVVPVAGDLYRNHLIGIRQGRLSKAIRFSGALPPMFSAAQHEGRRYVDGGLIANVPTDVLRAEGADLVLASNIIPGPVSPKSPRGRQALKLLRYVPGVARMVDAGMGLLMLMHSAGNTQAHAADVLYEAEPIPFSPVHVSKGAQIVEHTRDQPQFAVAVDDMVNKWEALKGQPG